MLSYRNSRLASQRYAPSSGGWLAGILVLVLVIVLIGWGLFSAMHTSMHDGCHVTDKDRTSNSSGKSDMRIYTSNCGVFQVQDSILSWTWHSSDTYAAIQRGNTYNFKTRGFRIPFFSSFPNIVGVERTS